MDKIDLKKRLAPLYAAKQSPSLVDVPPLSRLALDGAGDPNGSQDFHQVCEALFSLAYALKFMVKKGPLAMDYGVLPLEGLWWAADMNAFTLDRKDQWLWTLLVVQPEWITSDMVEEARREVSRKKKLPRIGEVRFETVAEGPCAQLLHTGPFDQEGPSVARLHAFIEDQGLSPRGRHHEIYLSDTRRADPAKWKTIIRQPVEKRES